MSRLLSPAVELDYPSSDGKPMAENDAQLGAILYAISALRVYFSARPDVYVSGDLLIYYEEGNPRTSIAPDTFVVFGVADRVRMNYRVWKEGKGPDFVLEVASKSTWREDVETKPGVYARLGVGEYFLYDPTAEYLSPPLQGYRLVDGAYERRPAVESIDGALVLRSETLGLELWAKDGEMRFRDPATGEELRSLGEERATRLSAETRARRSETHARRAETQARQAENRARRETAARRVAEIEVEREVAARRAAEIEAKREATARRAAQFEAEREAVARRAVEARIAELERRLGERDAD